MYVSEICAEGIFVTFPWWLKNVKSRSKVALFSNERHFEIWFPKKRRITFFWSKWSKLHKKDPILNVATTFSLKQGETRTSHGPIPHPLNWFWNYIGPTNFVNSLLSTKFSRPKSRVLDKHKITQKCPKNNGNYYDLATHFRTSRSAISIID